jgi:hypothetical protein
LQVPSIPLDSTTNVKPWKMVLEYEGRGTLSLASMNVFSNRTFTYQSRSNSKVVLSLKSVMKS